MNVKAFILGCTCLMGLSASGDGFSPQPDYGPHSVVVPTSVPTVTVQDAGVAVSEVSVGSASGVEWSGDVRSIVTSIQGARAQDQRYHGVSGRERYLRREYPTPEARARIMPGGVLH